MNYERTCPSCSTPVPASSPEDLCPRCLLATGLKPVSTPGLLSRPPEPAALNAEIPDYEILELIGQGGLGAVYRARHVANGQIVALKTLPPSLDPAFGERFKREIEALARLDHPNVVRLFGHGRAGDRHYLVMQYVSGASLRTLLARREIDRKRGIEILIEVCLALEHAHSAGLVHRDVKPENILIDREGRSLVADFGLAKILAPVEQDVTLTPTRLVVGTPHYMAPEQLESPGTVGTAADVYSVAVLAYEILTGRLPLGIFPPPSETPGVDPRTDAILLPALNREPGRRPALATLTKQFRRLLTLPPPAASRTIPARNSVPERRSPAAGGAGSRPALMLVVLGAVFLFLTSFATWVGGEVTMLRPSKDGFRWDSRTDSWDDMFRMDGLFEESGKGSINETAWDTYLSIGLRIPAWVIVLLGVSLGITAAAAIGTGWTPARWCLLTGSLFGLAYCLLFLILVGGQGEELMMRWTSHAGFGAYCAVLAFGNMSVASWLVLPPGQSGSAARNPVRTPTRKRSADQPGRSGNAPRKPARKTARKRRTGRPRRGGTRTRPPTRGATDVRDGVEE